MSRSALFALDLVAIVVMTFGLYLPRHRRKDLLVAFLVLNVGVMAVADALSSSSVGAGVGLGLFGVLSIIRLRSSEVDQNEVAYYFAALALGLLGGLPLSPPWLSAGLMAAIVLALFVGDHPRLFAGYRTTTMNLDRAFTDEAALQLHLEQLLGASVLGLRVRKVDLVQDTTSVEVRYQIVAGRGAEAPAAREVGVR